MIGTGCSAVQFIPRVAELLCKQLFSKDTKLVNAKASIPAKVPESLEGALNTYRITTIGFGCIFSGEAMKGY